MFTINGQVWKIHLVSPNHYGLTKDNNEYAIGCCDNNTKCIYINDTLDRELMWRVLCHEITHAAMFSYDVVLCEQQEELLADLIATYGYEIVDATSNIFKKLKGRH